MGIFDDEVVGRFWGLALAVVIFTVVALCAGCVSVLQHEKTGLEKTAGEPLHAESGAGITIWKIPVIGIGGWGLGQIGDTGTPSIIIHKYDYQAQPQGLAPGTPSLPPTAALPVTYKTVYEAAWDDPTLVVFVNRTYRVMKLQIGDEPEIRLGPYQATANLHLAPGDYTVRKTIERPVNLGKPTMFDWVTFFSINITLTRHPYPIYLDEN